MRKNNSTIRPDKHRGSSSAKRGGQKEPRNHIINRSSSIFNLTDKTSLFQFLSHDCGNTTSQNILEAGGRANTTAAATTSIITTRNDPVAAASSVPATRCHILFLPRRKRSRCESGSGDGVTEKGGGNRVDTMVTLVFKLWTVRSHGHHTRLRKRFSKIGIQLASCKENSDALLVGSLNTKFGGRDTFPGCSTISRNI
ncbi:uncharacterized protein LOC129748744 [Uranotaenia lowii]|uniref:uncharacterized protein LOC129748744 n=1 Tax=Uranotaenia lowii TaxID=190385 RepID=UPI002478C293|nr:uncharacterized protein LOC129748744 [Uranotaenia lowii]